MCAFIIKVCWHFLLQANPVYSFLPAQCCNTSHLGGNVLGQNIKFAAGLVHSKSLLYLGRFFSPFGIIQESIFKSFL